LDIEITRGGVFDFSEQTASQDLWKGDGESHMELLAQQVREIIPGVVRGGDDPDGTLGLNYAELVPVLISAVKDLQEELSDQTSRSSPCNIDWIRWKNAKRAVKSRPLLFQLPRFKWDFHKGISRSTCKV
jgi:hypothetical protein